MKLPTEIILNIFSLCDSLTDLHALHALSSSCKTLHNILDSKAYDAILSRSLPAFDDALRYQRGSVAAIRYMIYLGYDKKDLEPLLPPAHVTQTVHVPRCHFNVQMGRYENVPSEMSIKKLSRTPIGSQWEAQRVLTVHRMLSSILSTAKLQVFNCLCVNVSNSSWRDSCDSLWFQTRYIPGMPESDQRPNGTPWTLDQTERFFRGAYRLWLFGYVFAHGCFWEPIVQEQKKFPPPSFHPAHRLPY